MISGILLHILLRLYQTLSIFLRANQWAEELQMKPSFRTMSYPFLKESILTILKLRVFKASKYAIAVTLKYLNGVVALHGHIATILPHKFQKVFGHTLLHHQLFLLSVQLQCELRKGDLVKERT